MVARSFLAALALCVATHAQELAPLSAKYKADLEVVTSRRDAAISRIARTYTAALDTAEKSATTAGDVNTLKAISAEREGLAAKRMLPTVPATLPKSVLPFRKAYLLEFAKADKENTEQNKLVASSYLQALLALQSRSTGNPSLQAEIAAEKKRIIDTLPPDIATLTNKIGGTEWKSTSGRGAFTLHADGTVTNPTGAKGRWSLTSLTELILHWDGNPEQSWALNATGGTLKMPGHSYKRTK